MPSKNKNKPNKGLLKRIRFTKSGRVKFTRAFGRHKRSHKSAKLRRSYRLPTYAKSSDVKRIRALLFTKVSGGVSRQQQAESTASES